MIAHSYVWDTGDKPIPDAIPRQFAELWIKVAEKLKIKPVLTHAAVDLWNWELIDPTKPIELDNLRSIHTMTGTPDEEWFYLNMAAIEARGGRILFDLYDVENSVRSNNISSIHQVLIELKNALSDMCKILSRISGKCDPFMMF